MHNVHRMKEPENIDYALGAALFIKSSLLDEIGNLDEAFFFYGEETDFCLRTRRAGYRVVYYPDFQIKHLRGQSSSGAPSYFSMYHRYKSKHYYLKKNHSYLLYRLFWLRKVIQLSIMGLLSLFGIGKQDKHLYGKIILAHFKEF
jgi:hypothetical protein